MLLNTIVYPCLTTILKEKSRGVYVEKTQGC